MRRFVAAFFRHPFTLILPAILIPLIVVFLVRSLASSYSSDATIYITNNPYVTVSAGTNIPYSTAAQNLQSDMTEYMTHNSFVLNVAKKTDMPKTYKPGTANVDGQMEERIRAGLTITPIGNQTLSIQYNDPDAHVAAQVITQFLQEYLTEAIKTAEQTVDNDKAAYEQKLQDDEAKLKADDERVKNYIQQNPGIDPSTDSTLAILQAQYQNDLQQVSDDQQQIQKLNSANPFIDRLYNFQVADPPTIPTAPTVKSKTTLTAMIGGVALGLGVSLGLIGLLAVADRRIHSRDDLAEAFPVPVLEVIPRLRGLQEELPVVGSEETLASLSEVPVLATLPRFAESGGGQSGSRALSTRAEDEE